MEQLIKNWLLTLCSLVQGVNHAVVFLKPPEREEFAPIAFWPKKLSDYAPYANAAQAAFTKEKSVLLRHKEADTTTGEPFDIIACPLYFQMRPYGVIVLQTSSRTLTLQQGTTRQVEEAATWLETMYEQQSSSEKEKLVHIIELVASCLEHQRFQGAATDVLTDLTSRLSCDRISIGFLDGQKVTIEAVSHSAGFDRKSTLISDISEAMHEALDQNNTITYPETTETILLTRNHATLHEEHNIGNMLTVPFVVGGKAAGAVLVERAAAHSFDQAAKENIEQIVSMVGPILEVRRRDEQGLVRRLRGSLKRQIAGLIGPDHLVTKVSISAIAFGLIFLSVTSGDYRVTSTARLEALTQRVVVSPQSGFIAETKVRPGDVIHNGDILGSLDDKDLKLELRKWSSQLEQLQTEYRDALARHDRSKVSIVSAKLLQAEAQLNLVHEKLSRIQLSAPFDGFIVSGDLSQALGSPVERGQVLFTVAPLDAYRVILEVDERDIGKVKEGQLGSLMLSGRVNKPLDFTIAQITPVSTAQEGRNFFRVEAKIKENSDLLRPGMEGIGKIGIDRQKMIWIWSHRMLDWFRLTFWSLWP
ncbi:MAG: efflux RND transporter periplasmic adaptor subunit [Desulforhopalus sp.]